MFFTKWKYENSLKNEIKIIKNNNLRANYV